MALNENLGTCSTNVKVLAKSSVENNVHMPGVASQSTNIFVQELGFSRAGFLAGTARHVRAVPSATNMT